MVMFVNIVPLFIFFNIVSKCWEEGLNNYLRFFMSMYGISFLFEQSYLTIAYWSYGSSSLLQQSWHIAQAQVPQAQLTQKILAPGTAATWKHSAHCVCENSSRFSHVQLCATPWTTQPARLPPIHGILQARILDWVAISSSSGSSWPRDRTLVSYITCIGRRVLYH